MTYGAITNLHITLLGDEIRAGSYLPYGKQLVRQLMREGRYAGARSVSPANGVLVETRILGVQRWIRITAFACPTIFMDSGIAGLHNLGLQSPELTGRDGTLLYSDLIRAYMSEKKLLGSIKPPSVAATPSVELNATGAFEVLTEIVDGVAVRDEEDEARLVHKKFVASLVPPSVFTGKLRLYFQAHYGAALRSWRFTMNSANQPPSLDYDAGNDVTFQFHPVRTGLYTDSEKRHWLIQFATKGSVHSPNTVNIFRMAVSPCVEKLRGRLLSEDVSDEDKERIESYILSQSYPDFDFCITKACSVPAVVSMGYGWHFNWSGTKSDIVSISLVGTVGDRRWESTHYRIEIERDEKYIDDDSNTELQNEERRWKVKLVTVETKQWMNQKWVQTIAYPNWQTRQLSIFGVINEATAFGAAAPCYVFYTKDDENTPKVLRYSMNGPQSVLQWRVTSSPPYWRGEGSGEGTYPGDLCFSYGYANHDYSSTVSTEPTTRLTTSFSVGGVSVAGEQYTETLFKESKTRISFTPTGGTSGTYYISDNGVNTEAGDAIVATSEPYGCAVSVSYNTVFVPGPGSYTELIQYGAWSSTTANGWKNVSHNMLIVIPVGDAEAAYVYGNRFEESSLTGTTSHYAPTIGLNAGFFRASNGATWQREAIHNFSGGTPTTSAYNGSVPGTYTTTVSSCISNAGIRPFAMGSLGPFKGGEGYEEVPQSFYTRSSAISGDIDGENIPITGGYDSRITDKAFVFMGWA